MENNKPKKESQLSFNFEQKEKICPNTSPHIAKIISLNSREKEKSSFLRDKILKDVLNNSKSF